MGIYPESYLATMRKDIAALDARLARAKPEGDAQPTAGKPAPAQHHGAAAPPNAAHEGAH
jgi:NADH-quinone oxidoreductase subunit M